ncbi:protein-L-isoaspartate(D-aspartate) O-methyltransferase [Skermanella pratensis]|uniref:protein-L-isoaspartate(D-aspartate) O-methyltransferase n=1 Tax=Skermanella pratensis TaxID=2233999 RepID=UPI001FEA432D|nr:protein-L-isoaspartate(D-aspartate) O-methyltransferase [Skermanella pratensis]
MEIAYDDSPLPIEQGQTISQPFVVALMMQAAELVPGAKVLEIGTGSGYSAAALAAMGCEVYSIDRHASLVEAARTRLERAGYAGIHLRAGDGTLGWPEVAPFDAVIVTAGGPRLPEPLSRQLKVGGRMIMPAGAEAGGQRLIRQRRTGEDMFAEEDLGLVAFVPLIGAHGWPEATRTEAMRRSPALPPDAAERVRDAAEPLPDVDDERFGVLFDRIADARVVLLGEATHGTSEFHRARARITERLITRHGFTVVAVEADWPDAEQIDRYVRGRPPGGSDDAAFSRFPAWMWRNEEVAGFVDWLRRHNDGVPEPRRRVGFHGLDLYGLNGSIAAVLDYLDEVDPQTAGIARERYGCLAPWRLAPETYGRAAQTGGFDTCEKAVLDMLRELLDKRLSHQAAAGEDSWLDARQNARLIASAEEYYRTLYHGATTSWNLRDRHMFETLRAVMETRGPETKAVVWAHNTHVGDAAATEMGRQGQVNLGMLCREAFGSEAALVGFGTDRGTVVAASGWGGPMEVMEVPPAHPDSYEHLCVRSGKPRFLLDLRPGRNEPLVEDLKRLRLERAIGAIYRPGAERENHYFQASLPGQFDLYVWFDRTTAIRPLAPIAPPPGRTGSSEGTATPTAHR